MRADHYDDFARAYSDDNDRNLLNAHYERPAMIRLAGDVYGLRVLDAGCGSGPLAEALRSRGALVSGFDGSPAMIELAQGRLGDDTDLRVVDLAGPLPWADASFDVVTLSLVLHYLEDWRSPLAEVRRVLRPGGRLVVSVNHPFVYRLLHPETDYFTAAEWGEEYEFSGLPATLTYWHRPLGSMVGEFISAGFRVVAMEEPPFDPSTPHHLLPPTIGNRTSFLSFLFFVLEAT